MTRKTGRRTHFDKYAALAESLGVDALKKRILAHVTLGRLQQARDAGDDGLNRIPLRVWDAAAGRQGDTWNLEKFWPGDCVGPSTVAERVCLLKHVAKYHLAGFEFKS